MSSGHFALEEAQDQKILAELSIYEMLTMDSIARKTAVELSALCAKSKVDGCEALTASLEASLDEHLRVISDALDKRANSKDAALRRMQGKIARLLENIAEAEEGPLSASMSSHALNVIFDSTKHLKKIATQLMVQQVKRQMKNDQLKDKKGKGKPVGSLLVYY